MNTRGQVAEQIYRVRRMYSKFWSDDELQFYKAKRYLRKSLGRNFVVIMEPRSVRVFYENEMVRI